MSGYVYAIGIEHTIYIKIGRARSPKARMASMQTSLPFKLELLYVLKVEYPLAVERALHKMLDDSRVRGEWFEMPQTPLPTLFADAESVAVSHGDMSADTSKMEPSILGKRIAQVRKQRGWTQEQLCREARVALNTVARLEQGHLQQLRTDSLLKLAKALNISTDHLLGHKVKSHTVGA